MGKLPQLPGMDVEKELEEFRKLVLHCLIKYGNLEKETAETMMNNAYFFANLENPAALIYLFHEEPYYWAMTLIKTDPYWYKDPKLWPPPEDRYELLGVNSGSKDVFTTSIRHRN